MATVARIWRGVIRTEDRDAYNAYLAGTGIKEYRQTPGNQGARILTRDLGDGRTEMVFRSTIHTSAEMGGNAERGLASAFDRLAEVLA